MKHSPNKSSLKGFANQKNQIIKDDETGSLSDKQFLFLLDDLATKREWTALEQMCLISLKSTPFPHPVILNFLSRAYFEGKKYKLAETVIRDLLEMVTENNFPEEEIWRLKLNLTKCLYYQKRSPEAIEIIESFPEERLNSNEILVEHALYYNAIGNVEKSWELLNRISNKEKYDAVAFNSAWFLFRQGKFKEAFGNIVRGANIKVWGNEDEIIKKAKVDKSKRWIFKEKVDIMAFYLEGGMGDEMVFLRYIQFLTPYANKIKIFCANKLVNLLKECGYQNVFTHADIATEKWDKYVPSMSSPYILELDDPKKDIIFPYLVREAQPVEEMNRIANGKKKICIKWKGNPLFEHDQFREFPLDGLLKLDKFGQLFSIQIEDNEELPKNANVWDLSHIIDSWSDTYNVINESDLLVTSCSSVAHLAGIMGKKVIVLVPLVPYVIWSTDSQPWYPDNVTVVRQKEYGSWDSAFEELYEKVEEILK